MANLSPLGSRVVVKALEAETKTASGIYIPDTANKEKSQKGTVIAVGPGELNEKELKKLMSVKVGDIVVYSQYGPSNVKIDNEEFLILHNDDILATIS